MASNARRGLAHTRLTRLKVCLGTAVVVVLLVGACGDDSEASDREERAREFHETRDLMADVIGETLFRTPEARDRLIDKAASNNEDITGADTDFDRFMELGSVNNEIIGIYDDLEQSGKYLPEIDPRDR
jgi:hypothetical protein